MSLVIYFRVFSRSLLWAAYDLESLSEQGNDHSSSARKVYMNVLPYHETPLDVSNNRDWSD